MGKRFPLLLMSFAFLLLLGQTAICRAMLTFGKFETGFLVPVAIYNPVEDTVVGINVQTPGLGRTIFWSFHAADGSLRASGSIPVTPTRSDYSFSLAASAGGVGHDQVGYLIFVLDDDGILQTTENDRYLGGHAFLVNPGNGDAALLPVAPLAREDFAPVDLDLTVLNAASIVQLTYGQAAASRFKCRYLLDPALGATTRIVLWTFQDAPPQFTGRIRSVDHPTVADVVLVSREKRVNVLSILENLAGRPHDFIEGSVLVDNPGTVGVCFVIVWSELLRALQTLPALDVE